MSLDENCYDPLYIFKGAQSAPVPGSPPILRCAAQGRADSGCGAASARQLAGPKPGSRDAPGAACRSLALAGHGGVGAHLVPGSRHHGAAPQRQHQARYKNGHRSGARS
jgi:hypothetical protein